MSNTNLKTSNAVAPRRADDDELYFSEDRSGQIDSLKVEHFEKDRICSLCGLWKSEHRWEICGEPNWL